MSEEPEGNPLRDFLPAIVAALAAVAFFITRNAGHSSSKALLVAMIMTGMCGVIILVNRSMGNMNGGIFLLVLSGLMALAQFFGWV